MEGLGENYAFQTVAKAYPAVRLDRTGIGVATASQPVLQRRTAQLQRERLGGLAQGSTPRRRAVEFEGHAMIDAKDAPVTQAFFLAMNEQAEQRAAVDGQAEQSAFPPSFARIVEPSIKADAMRNPSDQRIGGLELIFAHVNYGELRHRRPFPLLINHASCRGWQTAR